MKKFTFAWPFIGAMIILCIWLLSGCSIHSRQDSRETALLTLWTLAEEELEQAILNQEERNKLSNAIEKALNLCEDRHDGTFSEIMAVSSLDKEKFHDVYRLASVMDLVFVVELRDEYREQLREILLSLKSLVYRNDY